MMRTSVLTVAAVTALGLLSHHGACDYAETEYVNHDANNYKAKHDNHHHVNKVTTKIYSAPREPVTNYSKNVKVPEPVVVITPQCPDEYELVGQNCVSRHEIPEEHVCPPSTSEHHGECRSRISAHLSCPNGFRLEGKTCLKEEIGPLVKQCPEGSQQLGNQCVVKLRNAPTCPSGASQLGDKCVRYTALVSECPTGYTQRGDLCAAQVYEEPDSVCPLGSHPDGNVCTVVTVAEEICPNNTVDVGERCATYKNRSKQCPQGFSFAGKSCIRTETVSKLASCANGGDPDNNCIVRIPVPPSPYCKIGTICSTGQCVKPRRTRPQYKCPDGYTIEGGKSLCQKVTTYDCTETHRDIECEVPAVPAAPYPNTRNVGKAQHYRRLKGVDYKGKVAHVNYTKLGAVPKCEQKKVQHKTCEKIHTATPEASCASGTFKGTYCEEKDYFAPDYRCDAKTDRDGNCFVEERSPVLLSCPSGYTKTAQGCTRTELSVPEYYCPSGSVEPNCATYVEKICPAGKCEHDTTAAPRLVCPEGYHMLQGDHHFQEKNTKHHLGYKKLHSTKGQWGGPKCVKTIYAEKSKVCPQGTIHIEGELKCASYIEIEISNSDKKVPMSQSCPLGYAANHGQCVKLITESPVVNCTAGSFPFGYECIKTVGQIAVCPTNSKREHGRCYAESLVTPILLKTSCSYDTPKSSCLHKAHSTPRYSATTGKYRRTKHQGGAVVKH